MRLALTAAGLLLLPATAFAYDTAMEKVDGNWQPMKQRHPTVQMEWERVRIDIYAAHYETTATFQFHNTGAATQVTMGFPEGGRGYGLTGGKRTTTAFTTSVDGRAVAARRVPATEKRNGYFSPPQSYQVKQVRFARGQRHLVRVHFRVPMKDWEWSGRARYADYNLTGGNWRGAARETVVTTMLHTPGTYVAGATFNGALQPLQQKTNAITFRRSNWKWHEAEGVMVFHLLTTLPGWMVLNREGPLGVHLDRHYTITLPGKPPAIKGNPELLGFTPPVVQRNGTTFITLGDLRDGLGRSDRKGEAGEVEVRREVTSNTWRLKAGDYLINFPVGQSHMEVEGQGNVKLPAPSFEAGGNYVYVPLAPVLAIFHGKPRLDTKAHRAYLDVPPFWKTAPKPARVEPAKK